MGNIKILTEVELFDFDNLDITDPALLVKKGHGFMHGIMEELNLFLPDWIHEQFRPYYCDIDGCFLGAAAPERLQKFVRDWNKKIIERAKEATQIWLNAPEVNSPASYTVGEVFCEVADNFSVNCTYATYIERESERFPGWNTAGWHTVLSDEDIAAVTEHPERYLVISAYWT